MPTEYDYDREAEEIDAYAFGSSGEEEDCFGDELEVFL